MEDKEETQQKKKIIDPLSQTSNQDQNQNKKDIKSLSLDEQVNYYKDQFTKTRKLFLHFEKETKNLEIKVKSLQEKISKYEPQMGATIKILYKYKHGNNSFYFLQSEDEKFYVLNQNQVIDLFSNNINLDEGIPCYSYEKDFLKSDETLNLVIQQYDERIHRLKNEIELYEQNFLQYKDIKSNSALLLDTLKNFYNNGIQNIIASSNEIHCLIKNTSELEFSDEYSRHEVFKNINSHIDILKKSSQEDVDEYNSLVNKKLGSNNVQLILNQGGEIFQHKWLTELKNFIFTLLKNYKDSLYKQVCMYDEFYEEKLKWQNTIDQIMMNNANDLNSSKFLN